MTTNPPVSQQSSPPSQPFTLLVPLDGSSLAEQALPIAAQVCRSLSGKLVLARVLPTQVVPLAAVGGYVPGDVYQQLEDDERQLAQDYLKLTVDSLRPQGLAVETRLAQGEPATTLLAVAESLPANLIVMTTHGRTGLTRFALGSVADRVVRGGHVPMLLLRSTAGTSAAPTLTLQRALVPLDGSPLAERALDLTGQLAGSLVREITLLRVVDPRDGAQAVEQAQQYLDTVRSQLLERLTDDTCLVGTQVRSGSAADIILASASQPSDFVLIATHGTAGVGRWVVGSVADRVLRGGNTPLLLIHPAHSQAEQER